MGAAAIYPGTFDPLTNGHTNIVARAASMFDKVTIAIAISTPKRVCFTIEERLEMANTIFAEHDNVVAAPFDGLTVDCARQHGATVILRGVRGVTDFDYELQLAGMNRRMAPEVNTVFLAPEDGHGYISSTLVREISGLRGHIEGVVHPVVLKALREKFGDPKDATTQDAR